MVVWACRAATDALSRRSSESTRARLPPNGGVEEKSSLSAATYSRREQMSWSSYERATIHRRCHFSSTPSFWVEAARADQRARSCAL